MEQLMQGLETGACAVLFASACILFAAMLLNYQEALEKVYQRAGIEHVVMEKHE